MVTHQMQGRRQRACWMKGGMCKCMAECACREYGNSLNEFHVSTVHTAPEKNVTTEVQETWKLLKETSCGTQAATGKAKGSLEHQVVPHKGLHNQLVVKLDGEQHDVLPTRESTRHHVPLL